MSQNKRPFSLLDLLVVLGFTLGATAAALGVLTAAIHIGRRDGVRAQLEGEAEVALGLIGLDLMSTRATPTGAVKTEPGRLVLEADLPFSGHDENGVALVTHVDRASAGAPVLQVDFGPGQCDLARHGACALREPRWSAQPAAKSSNSRSTGAAFDVVVTDGKQRNRVRVSSIDADTGAVAVEDLAAWVKPGAHVIHFDRAYWRHASANAPTTACEPGAPCALWRRQCWGPSEGPLAIEPLSTEAPAGCTAGHASPWVRIADDLRTFEVKTLKGGRAVEVKLVFARQSPGKRAHRFVSRRTFSIERGSP